MLPLYLMLLFVIILSVFSFTLTCHIIKGGRKLEKEKGIMKGIIWLFGIGARIFNFLYTPFIKAVFWLIEQDWWFAGPLRRFLPYFLCEMVTKLTYAGEIYTTEETIAIVKQIYTDVEKNGLNDHFHITLSPCVCRHAIDNWSDEMPGLTCVHFQFFAKPAKAIFDGSMYISGETLIDLLKEYASKWPYVHIFYGFCPEGSDHMTKQIALCFCHHHCVTMRCEIFWGKYGLHPFKRGDHISEVVAEDCVGCGVCIEKCPFFAITKTEDDKVRVIPEDCYGCGVCKRFCPNDAIILKDRPHPKEHFIPKDMISPERIKSLEA